MLLLTRGKVEIPTSWKCQVLCVKSQTIKGLHMLEMGLNFLSRSGQYTQYKYIFISLWPFEEGFSIKEESYPLFQELPYILKRRDRNTQFGIIQKGSSDYIIAGYLVWEIGHISLMYYIIGSYRKVLLQEISKIISGCNILYAGCSDFSLKIWFL